MSVGVATYRPTTIAHALAALEAWLETMRGPEGYFGPVAHWWQQSLLYTGPGHDWRYEGIIAGYVTLWQRTGSARWLNKACRAGDDLLEAQMPSGHFSASAFEQNPASAGTPHEAACDVGLLLLAKTLRAHNDLTWSTYADAAERNLRNFYVRQLWDEAAQSFRDSPNYPSFVPNKVATLCEALFLLAELHGDERWVSHYALPSLERILNFQVRGGPLDGAIAQNSLGSRRIEAYFPLYIARCVPALLRGYAWDNDERYLDAALRALRFVGRYCADDRPPPTVIYTNRQVIRGPAWVAALGDVLRAASLLRPYGFDTDLRHLRQRMLHGQDTSGGIQTATGFAYQTGRWGGALPDFRDLLHVVGWCDKAFRYLAEQIETELPTVTPGTFATECRFRGHKLFFVETPDVVEATDRHGVQYRWRKGSSWAEVANPTFWLH